MARKVEKGAGLSLRQKQFLAVVLQQKYILDNFYLTGGTALSSWYLHHRESSDLDFFSERNFDGDKITSIIKKYEQELDYQALVVNDDYGFYSFVFRYADNSRFKVDFNHYSNFRITKGIRWRGLEIDSLYEIAINKIQTIRIHPRDRDYVDLFFILKKTNWKIDNLITDADKKFKMTADIMSVAKNFLKVAEITIYPKIIVPFDRQKMVEFYQKLALDLKPKIFK